jgi:L-alanine-DL-glutamate epimerase-like enolase superfamily enzyme
MSDKRLAMSTRIGSMISRRGLATKLCQGSLMLGSCSLLSDVGIAAPVNERTRASDLRITDLRYATLTGIPMGQVPILRIDTNQGICGWGEVRDGANPHFAMMLKSRLLGENPCDVDRIFRKLKQFGGHARQGGGVSGVEIALWDLAGKAYDVPTYQLLGGKFRNRVRLYADTPIPRGDETFSDALQRRIAMGFTVLKMDLGLSLLADQTGMVSRPLGTAPSPNLAHMFTGWELTPRGIDALSSIVAQVREQIGWELPLAADHFGHIGVNSCIRLGKALERYNLAWLEDMIPWQQTELLKQITAAVDIPILTGEDIYLKEPFQELIESHAVDMVHPDICSAGGMLETKKIADFAGEHGVPLVIHCGGSPIAFMASVHVAAAIENFHSLEFHSADVPFWSDLVSGVDEPIIDQGWARVPNRPGLGLELNEEEARKHILEGSGFFEPTNQWNELQHHDRTWS